MANLFPPDPAAPDAPRPSLRFRLGRLGRLARKELTEVLRDRRTLLTLVLMPILLYPLLALAFRFFLAEARAAQQVTSYRLGFRTEADRDYFMSYLAQGLWALPAAATAPAAGGPFEPTADNPIVFPPPPEFITVIADDPEDDLRHGKIDLAFRTGPQDRMLVRPQVGLALDADLLLREDSPYSREAARIVERLCGGANAVVLSNGLRSVGIPQRPAPLRLRPVSVPRDGAGGGWSLAAFLPLVLTLMTITGAVYPAIDLTAGERERGTLEILVAAPIPRVSVLFGKYVAVVAVAVLTALVNVAAMVLSLSLSGLARQVFGPAGLPPLVILQVLGLLLLFASFFSAVLLILTSYARSFKEAQAYLIPIMLLALAPGLLALVPEISLQGPLTLVPLLNIVLLARDLLEGHARPGPAILVILSTAVYAFLALALAARLFGAEAVLYTETGGLRAFLTRRRRATVFRPPPLRQTGSPHPDGPTE